MKSRHILLVLLCLTLTSAGESQTTPEPAPYRKFYIGSTLWELGNFIPDDPNPPDLLQLNFGYRITPKSVVSVEAKTWKYAWPLGIPWGNLRGAPEEKYPGFVRAFGLGLVYQYFWWKGAYVSIDAGNMLQKFYDENGAHIQDGYQLFMTYRLGYHFRMFRDRFFIEPSVAVTHWPINTNVPDGFVQQENKWPNYFLFEPGLHFGFKF